MDKEEQLHKKQLYEEQLHKQYHAHDGIEHCQQDLDYHEIIECITCALDAKDAYTAGHSQRVSDMSVKVCQLMGMKDENIEKIHIAAHLHDIGKIGVPDAILNKTERLDETEWQMIKKHPSIGAEILSKSHHLSELKDIVLSHHERFDGKGYTWGLKGLARGLTLFKKLGGNRNGYNCCSINSGGSDWCGSLVFHQAF